MKLWNRLSAGFGIVLLSLAGASVVHGIGPYYIQSGETVLDLATGLEWQRYDDAVERTWQQGLQYCEDLVADGHDDWRLPNIRELDTLVDLSRFNPAIDPIFADQPFAHWSSTTYQGDSAQAWSVDFYSGMEVHQDKTIDNQCTVRCVRSGLVPLFLSVTGNGAGTVQIEPSGTICDGNCREGYEYGTAVTLTATPETDSVFSGWSVGSCSGIGPCVVTMNQAFSVSAVFTSTLPSAGSEGAANVPVGNGWWLVLSLLVGAGYMWRSHKRE